MVKKIFFICLILLTSISFVNSLGVASPYWSDNPLKISPGESIKFNLNLQNVVGEKDILIKVSIIDDGDGIAKLIEGEKTYLVPKGSYDIHVPVEIKIPESSDYKKVEVKIEFTPTTESEGGMVEFSTQFTQIIPVEIIPESKTKTLEENLNNNSFKWIIIWTLIVSLIIIFIIARILMKRKESIESLDYSMNQNNS